MQARGITAILLVLATLVAPAASARTIGANNPGASAARTARSRLVVQIAGLPRGARPDGLLKGPGVSRSIHGALTTLRIRPGRYSLVLHSVLVRVTGGARHRRRTLQAVAGPGVTITLRGGRRGTLRARYVALLPLGSVRVRPGAIHHVDGSGLAPHSVTFTGGAGLRVGGLLSSGPRPTLPDGLFARVVGLQRNGATTTATLAPVSLADALPQADLSFGGASAARQAGSAAPRFYPRTRDGRTSAHAADIGTGASVSLPAGPFSCGLENGISVGGSVHVVPHPSGYVHLSLFSRPRVDFHMTVDATATINVDASAGAQ